MPEKLENRVFELLREMRGDVAILCEHSEEFGALPRQIHNRRETTARAAE